MCHCGLKKDLKELSHTSHGRVKPGADNRLLVKPTKTFLSSDLFILKWRCIYLS